MNKNSKAIVFQYKDSRGHLHTATGFRNEITGKTQSVFKNLSPRSEKL